MGYAFCSTLEGEVILVPAGQQDDPSVEGIEVDASRLELREDAPDGSAVYSSDDGDIEVTFFNPGDGRPALHSIFMGGEAMEVHAGEDDLVECAAEFIEDED